MKATAHARERWKERGAAKAFRPLSLEDAAREALEEGTFYGRHAGAVQADPNERGRYLKESRWHRGFVFVVNREGGTIVTVMGPCSPGGQP